MTAQATPRTVLETLQQTRDLLADKSRWTIGSFARDESNTTVMATHERACKWCLEGALQKVTDFNELLPEANDRLKRLIPLDEHGRPTHHIPSLNDQVGHEAVLRLLDEAIAKEQR
jgi:hypothetical protein